MLVNCKECGLQISDKAIFCPHCGLPIKPDKISRPGKPKKLPNGFGQITKLKNQKLRKPYRVLITVGHDEDGKPISKILKPVGYFSSYKEAYEALIENAKNPYNEISELTTKEVYDAWSKEQYKTVSESTVNQYRNAWSYCSNISNVKFSLLRPKNLRDVILADNVPISVQKVVKILLNLLYDYAVENEIVEKNYSRMMKIKFGKDRKGTAHHISFSDEEISVLWKNLDLRGVKWLLVQCYTGMRPAELCEVKIDNIFLDENKIVAGKKTDAGRNREIPIHPCIKPIVEELVQISATNSCPNLLCGTRGNAIGYSYYLDVFRNIVATLKLNEKHAPHDPRVFFVTQAKKYLVDEYAIKLIVGHKIKDLTESVYTKRSFDWLYSEMSKIQCMNNV